MSKEIHDTPSYYSVIPASVRYDKRLTEREKLLYGEITCLCNVSGYCFAKNKYFAELYSCEIRTIQRNISNLVKYGYIRSIVKNNYERKIYLVTK